MAKLEEIKSALERLERNTETEVDRRLLVQALQEKVISIASGEGAVAAGGNIGNSLIVTGNGNVIHIIKPATAEALTLANQPEPVDAAGRWTTEELANPFDKNDKFRFHFDLEIKGEFLLGAITQTSTNNRYDSTRGILEGKIKGNSISFCIVETSRSWINGETKETIYKNYFCGSIAKDVIEFTLQSDRPWGFPPQKFNAKRE
jgi:hypothetical protein